MIPLRRPTPSIGFDQRAWARNTTWASRPLGMQCCLLLLFLFFFFLLFFLGLDG